MATRKRVDCINKKGDHFDAHERIQNIGGEYGGSRWILAESSAISNIKSKTEEYYVLVGEKSVDVIVANYNNKREYLKTVEDGYAPNNLLNLKECPTS